jgi:ATP-binding cassette subfamily C (CFTR/MRP) protein 1
MITLDGQNLARLGLHTVRKAISIIPQDPVLFSGTLRMNIDPLGHFDDGVIWAKIHQVQFMKNRHHDNDNDNDNDNSSDNRSSSSSLLSLDMVIHERGSNLSVGERQLLCMARALLKQSKVVVLDEATAAMDIATDRHLQRTLRDAFQHVTCLTIAHRIHTILDSDRILVMHEGRVAEFDAPATLLASENSMFSKLVQADGQHELEDPRRGRA